MKLKKLKLKNVRSYTEGEINFPEGSVLLSGSVGSGKSTILLAIDFALFGLQRGELSGNALLRNGESEGSVELHFEIANKQAIIKRCLKRSEKGVSQDSGWIMIDNKKSEATPQELKQRILELFNYPQNLLTKNKSLIFRYTVYTPQEEMKQILVGDKEARLETLRKVFGIDKYKRIVENAKIAMSRIKDEKRHLAGAIEDLGEKEELKLEKEKSLKNLNDELNRLLPNIQTINGAVKNKKLNVDAFEEKIGEARELNKKLALLDLELKHKISSGKKASEEIGRISAQIVALEKIKLDDEKGLKEELKSAEEKKKILESEAKRLDSKIREFETKKGQCDALIRQIGGLSTCPTCFQDVSDHYKNRIKENEAKKIGEFSPKLEELNKEKEKILADVSIVEGKLEELRENLRRVGIEKARLEGLEEKRERRNLLEEEQKALKKEIANINMERDSLFGLISKHSDVEELANKAKAELEGALAEQRKVELEKAKIETNIKLVKEMISLAEKEIASKLAHKNTLISLNTVHSWLDEQFLNMMGSMERKVMAKIHSDFNAIFSKWFNMLIDNETLTVNLNSEFSPLIEQNGYDMDYEFLSGGERTAVALAYRLALNQTINRLMSTIKTDGLLILDEPTDGFSSEQLDRMKPLLKELELEQVIVVSHESKIESFVDNVLRFSKNEHISRIC
ncbi:AAA family ATPase [Candidatus Woesearchaeota archaeon]|nr:AAA family ATPase [Candidatus Woesearchaeota archaeon]